MPLAHFSKVFSVRLKLNSLPVISSQKYFLFLNAPCNWKENVSLCLTNQTQVAWYKQNENGNLTPISEVDTVHVVSMVNGDKLLKIYKAKPYMAGNYTCRGRNGYGEDLKTVTVKVQGNLNTLSNKVLEH